MINNLEGIHHKYYECQCYSSEHLIKLAYHSKDKTLELEEEVFLSVHLHSSDNSWSRLKRAIKYVLGYKCKYGAWDEVILKRSDIREIHEIFSKYLEDTKEHTTDETTNQITNK